MLETLAAPREIRYRLMELYRSETRRGQLRRFLTRLCGGAAWLEHLESTGGEAEGHEQHYLGLQAIPIERICGTEKRAPAFDRSFSPIGELPRQRWLNIAEARLTGHVMPAVQLIERNGRYYVRDGHHRISVAHALGESFIDAEIVRIQTAQFR